MKTQKIENTVIDEANQRTYVIVAPRVLTDGEIYRAIRQEILRRGGRAIAEGETLTLTLTSTGRNISSVSEPALQEPVASPAVPNHEEEEHFTPSSESLG